MRQSLAIGIVTYFPTKETVNRITNLDNLGYSFYVYDNTPGKDFWPRYTNGSVLRNGKNNGLGEGLKSLTQIAHDEGWSYLMYFDEDIIFTKETITWVNQWLCHWKDERVGLYWFNYHPKANKDYQEVAPHHLRVAVSACSLINLKAAKNIGWHTTRWFIEGLDYDFCLRLAQKNWKIMGVNHCPGIDAKSNQPGLKIITNQRLRLYRIQPWKRVFTFTWFLINLTWRSLYYPPRIYSYVFFRNIFTYWYDQLHAIFWTKWYKSIRK